MEKVTHKWEIELANIDDIAKAFLKACEGQKVFAFFAEMGVGKTTFIKSLCRQLGVGDIANSPTYSIVNEYESDKGLVYHFDLYRLKSVDELLGIGFEDYLYQDAYVFIEWPELGLPFLDNFVKVEMNLEGEKRCLKMEY